MFLHGDLDKIWPICALCSFMGIILCDKFPENNFHGISFI